MMTEDIWPALHTCAERSLPHTGTKEAPPADPSPPKQSDPTGSMLNRLSLLAHLRKAMHWQTKAALAQTRQNLYSLSAPTEKRPYRKFAALFLGFAGPLLETDSSISFFGSSTFSFTEPAGLGCITLMWLRVKSSM